MMRHTLYIILAATLLLATTATHAIEPLAVRDGKVVEATTGKCQPLTGVSLAWHHFADQYYNADVVRTLVDDWHAEVVRAAVSVELGDGILKNPERAYKALYSVIDECIARDCYVVVDWHCHNIRLDEAKEFFTTVATKYGDKPNIIYEIFNEPEYQTWEEVKAYSEEVIATIRAIDSDNIIIVGCPHWDQDVDIVADDPIDGFDNLVYSFHFYAATHQQENMTRCDYALSRGLPLIISECGGMNHLGQGVVDFEWWGRWTEWARENGVGWIAWSLSDKVETCSMLRHGATPHPTDGGWGVHDLKDWSLLVMASLHQEYILNNEN